MARTPIELRIAGQTFRVVTSADPADLARLAAVVDAKLRELSGGKPKSALPPQMMLLAAIALAHDAEEATAARLQVERRTRDVLRRTLMGLDEVLESSMLHQEPAASDADVATHRGVGSDLDDDTVPASAEPARTQPAHRPSAREPEATGALLSALLDDVSHPKPPAPLDLRLDNQSDEQAFSTTTKDASHIAHPTQMAGKRGSPTARPTPSPIQTRLPTSVKGAPPSVAGEPPEAPRAAQMTSPSPEVTATRRRFT